MEVEDEMYRKLDAVHTEIRGLRAGMEEWHEQILPLMKKQETVTDQALKEIEEEKGWKDDSES